ncbi:lactoylglutathione lyase family protein [Pseudomonas asplenii]|uniref:Lactoylglutathione lyase family protein n=1 Tax=Pseudomonas asplenii TaxID=53407 RepID=A0A0M9GJ20_9PSED|nr:VOC family protein [Pseudomonas fuscovaginae]KPA92125.1 lactoylglutathione lyase family protein [Pseudomonas fuscovaginae]
MKFGYTIVYVPDVAATLAFFGDAFGLATRFLDDSGDYGELETGATTLAFASRELADSNCEGGYHFCEPKHKPLGIEIALVTDDVQAAHHKALAAGASEHAAVTRKPWGQVVSYVRCPSGTLIELCSPVGQ